MKKVLGLIAITLGFFMALLDTTIVNITLPKMTAYYGTDVKTISWVLNGYNLAFAVCLITASRLADQFGRKKVYLMGVTLFTFSSLLSGLSSSVEMLITFRVIQGLAAALVVPVTMPMSIEMVSDKRRGALMGFWGAFAGLAAASGPALGGVLTENLDWQSIFFINIPIGIVTVALCAILVKESFDPTASRRIDWLGMMTISVFMFCLILALIQANDKGWGSSYIISLFAVSLIALIGFGITERHVKEPLVSLKLLKNVPFSTGNLALLMAGLGLMSGVFLLTFYLTNVLGMTEIQAGLLITALPLTSMVFSGVSGALSQKFGNRWFTMIGMLALGASIYLFGGLTPNSTNLDIIWRLMVGGLGLGFSMAPLLDAVMKSVPQDKSGVASGISNMARTLGQVLGAAILITILSSNMSQHVESAKASAVTLVQRDMQLSKEAKAQFVTQVRSAGGTNVPALADILAKMEKQKQHLLSVNPPQAKQQIEQQFAGQEREIRTLYPQIKSVFTTSVSDAFDETFKMGSFMMLLGVVLGMFSDPRKRFRNQLPSPA